MQPPVVLLTLGAGANTTLPGSIPKPLPWKPSGSLTGPVDELSWIGFRLSVLRVMLTALSKGLIKVSGPTNRTDGGTCRIPVLPYKSW